MSTENIINNENLNLKQIAEQTKNAYSIEQTVPNGVDIVNELPKNEVASTPSVQTDSAPVIVIPGMVSPTVSADSHISEAELGTTGGKFDITDEELRQVMPDLDGLTYKTTSTELRGSLSKYRKYMMINSGLLPEEVDEAVRNRLKSQGTEINNKYLETNPKLGIVEVDKKNVDDLQFSEEEKAKLAKVKAIRLVTVEDAELRNLRIDKVDKKVKSAYLKTVEGNLSKYSVPLPLLGDFITFKGAQIIQLIGTVKYEDDSLDELISKKSSLIYDRMVGGALTEKYDENNKVILSYQDFVNKFKFHDIDMALFGILVASSMEEVESQLACAQCNEKFQWKYNLKTLLKLDNIPEHFKESINTILGNKYNVEVLNKIADNENKIQRYKSPFTNNIYDIAYPSIARAVEIWKAIDQNDNTMVYLATLGMFLHSMFVYNPKNDNYVHIEEDEIRILMENLQIIPQEDIDMLQAQLKDMMYSPEFKLETKCPICGNKMTNNLSVDDLVFLRAQDTSTEIR